MALAQFSQQGPKLVGINAQQGWRVSLSSDGNTAIVGGYYDNGGAGAAWVYTRSGTSWKQQQKLVGTPATANANQGYSVALSSDFNTAIVRGRGDSGNTGAAWTYTRSGATWTLGTGAIGTGDPFGCQGTSVALSPGCKTALVSGPADDGGAGAAWVYTRSGTTWKQQQKLVDGGRLAPTEGFPYRCLSTAIGPSSARTTA